MPRITRRKTLIIICLAAIVAGFTYGRMTTMWDTYNRPVVGVMVEGDKNSPPTRWWNHLYLAVFGWKVVTVFEVSAKDAERGYSVGYLPIDGKGKVEIKLNYDRFFRMRNGHEDCTFFAINEKGEEVHIEVVGRTTIRTGDQGIPLH